MELFITNTSSSSNFENVRAGDKAYLVYINAFNKMASFVEREFTQPFERTGRNNWTSRHQNPRYKNRYYSTVHVKDLKTSWTDIKYHIKGRLYLNREEAMKYFRELRIQDIPILKANRQELVEKLYWISRKIAKIDKRIKEREEM